MIGKQKAQIYRLTCKNPNWLAYNPMLQDQTRLVDALEPPRELRVAVS